MKKILLLCFSATIYLATQPVTAQKTPKNVIFLIADGMGIAQVYAGMVVNGNKLNIERCTYSGFSKTYSANKFITDSGAAGTALACGVKTNNGMIGMTVDSVNAESILELSKKNKLATGIVAASSLTHVTSACFVAHQLNRSMYEEIAADYLKADVDVIIGGGRKCFENRIDGRNLIDELKAKNYQIANNIDAIKVVKSGKLAGLVYDDQVPPLPERGSMLSDATMAALEILSHHKKGFFLMVQGSQIDWSAHDKNISQLVSEMIDFDKTVGLAIDFAEREGNTLVVVTANHETGGLALLNGKFGLDSLSVKFETNTHSAIPVPVFSYGPGADQFCGFMENSSFKQKFKKLLKLK